MPSVLRLHGRLDAGALQAAIAASVARHEILRTRIEIHDGHPAPGGRSRPGSSCRSSTWARSTRPRCRRTSPDIVTARFDLAAGLPIRAALLRLGADEHVLALAIHHIAGDGWSMGVLLGEVAAHYAGRSGTLPPLPIQYADVALWQRAQLADGTPGAPARLLARRAGRRARHARPCRSTGPAAPCQGGATRSARAGISAWSCDAELVTRLRGVARRSDATLFMLMLTRRCRRCWRAGAGSPTWWSAPRWPSAPDRRRRR